MPGTQIVEADRLSRCEQLSVPVLNGQPRVMASAPQGENPVGHYRVQPKAWIKGRQIRIMMSEDLCKSFHKERARLARTSRTTHSPNVTKNTSESFVNPSLTSSILGTVSQLPDVGVYRSLEPQPSDEGYEEFRRANPQPFEKRMANSFGFDYDKLFDRLRSNKSVTYTKDQHARYLDYVNSLCDAVQEGLIPLGLIRGFTRNVPVRPQPNRYEPYSPVEWPHLYGLHCMEKFRLECRLLSQRRGAAIVAKAEGYYKTSPDVPHLHGAAVFMSSIVRTEDDNIDWIQTAKAIENITRDSDRRWTSRFPDECEWIGEPVLWAEFKTVDDLRRWLCVYPHTQEKKRYGDKLGPIGSRVLTYGFQERARVVSRESTDVDIYEIQRTETKLPQLSEELVDVDPIMAVAWYIQIIRAKGLKNRGWVPMKFYDVDLETLVQTRDEAVVFLRQEGLLQGKIDRDAPLDAWISSNAYGTTIVIKAGKVIVYDLDENGRWRPAKDEQESCIDPVTCHQDPGAVPSRSLPNHRRDTSEKAHMKGPVVISNDDIGRRLEPDRIINEHEEKSFGLPTISVSQVFTRISVRGPPFT